MQNQDEQHNDVSILCPYQAKKPHLQGIETIEEAYNKGWNECLNYILTVCHSNRM